jgi:hypothetical protein
MSETKKKKVKIKNDDICETYDYMKTNKDNIKNVIKNKDDLIIINNLAILVNKIVIHALQFLKLYILYLYDNNLDFPKIDKEFICDIFKVITIRKCGSGGYTEDNMPKQMKDLKLFYDEHYKTTIVIDDILYYDKLSYILAYEAIDIEKNITNNIQEHYEQHINKFVNITFELKDKLKEINEKYVKPETRKQKKKLLYAEFRNIKNDLLSLSTEYKSYQKYHNWITEQKKYIIPNKTKYDKDNILYDIKSNTIDYLKCFVYIGKEIEKYYDLEDKNNRTFRLFNILPLRTNIIPKNIVIDTAGLIQNFLGDEPTKEHLKNYKKNDNQKTLWKRIFKIDEKVFKKNNYIFNYMIRTDGVSLSVLFIRIDKEGNIAKKKLNNKISTDTKYIEDIQWTEKLKKKRVVCADPNLADIIYCGSKDKNGNLEIFRYTQNQRRLETRTKKYNKIIHKENTTTIIDGQTIKNIESKLSNYNSKTNNFNKFKTYIIEKNKINDTLYNHYEQNYFRKFKLNRFINTQKSEAKLITNFHNKFGTPEDVLFIMGDYDKGNNHMKGVEPIICKRIRKIFKNAGYETYLINEYRTSKLCNNCRCELERFLIRENKKPKKIAKNNFLRLKLSKDNSQPKHKGKKCLVNGLLHHKDDKHNCKLIHNRDKNAVQNMLKIVSYLKEKGRRPKIFRREKIEK